MSILSGINFAKYGLDWKFTPEMTFIPDDFINGIPPAVIVKTPANDLESLVIKHNSGNEFKINITGKLKSGTYGIVYSTDTFLDEANTPLVVKTIPVDLIRKEIASQRNEIAKAAGKNAKNRGRSNGGVTGIIEQSKLNYGSVETKLDDVIIEAIQETVVQILIYESTKDLNFPEINLKGPFAPKFLGIAKDETSLFIVMEKLEITLEQLLDPTKLNPPEPAKS